MKRQNVLKKNKSVLLFIFAVLLFGCASTSGSDTDTGGDINPRPSWVDQYPGNNEYYTGIGGSSTGVEADDMELAKARAYNALASEISVAITSSTTYREIDDGEGGHSRTAAEEINAVVSQNLQAIETMDSWYSANDGGWYYVRLNKAEWEAIQLQEMNDIKKRVMTLVEPVVKDKNRTLSETISVLLRRLGHHRRIPLIQE